MAPNGGGALFLALLTSCQCLNWNSDIVSTDALRRMGEQDALHQYYGNFVNDKHVFPDREAMASKVGSFVDVNSTDLVNHDYNSMTLFLKKIALTYPQITHLYSVGKSVEGRDLWVIIVSDNPREHELLEPEVKIVGNMHGNEVVGREAALYLLDILCKNYGRNAYLTKYVNNTRLHLMPSMNPDGYEKGFPGDRMGYRGRENANGIDLNRNFPAQWPEHIEQSGGSTPEPETKVMMKWLLEYPFVLSINLHGGSLVANYPWDDSTSGRDGEYSPTSDDVLFVGLAYRYARAHRNMWKSGRRCGLQVDGDTFLNGITNGAGWYHLAGGMQDWQYIHSNALEITVEMGCFKFPTNEMLPILWADHEFSLLSFLEYSHFGVKGIVTDSAGVPIANATVNIERGKEMKTTKDGEYWRILAPGEHEITVSAYGLESETFRVTVNHTLTVRNVTLSACSEEDATRSTLRRGHGDVRIAVVGVTIEAEKILRKLGLESCNDVTFLTPDISTIIVPRFQSAVHTQLLHSELPHAVLAVADGLLESVVFSAGEKVPQLFHKDAFTRSLQKALEGGKQCDITNHPLRDITVAKLLDDLDIPNSFQLGVGLSCTNDTSKQSAAVAGILKMLHKTLTRDSVDEYSVQPSADPSDHFSPEESVFATSAAMPILEEKKGCTRKIEHPVLKMAQMGTGLPPYTLVMGIEKKTETMVYQMASTYCDSKNADVQKILQRSTIVFLPEIPHTQLNCHDYGSIAPFENLIEEVQKTVPQIDYVVMFASGGLKVRYINETYGISERLAKEYRQEHLQMLSKSDVCSGGIPMERDVIKKFTWDDKSWGRPDALLVQTGCCYEDRGEGGLYKENERAIRRMMLLRTKGVLVRSESTHKMFVKDQLGRQHEMVQGAVFVPLEDGHHMLKVERDGEMWTELSVEVSNASAFHERYLGESGGNFVLIALMSLMILMGCCFVVRGRFTGFFNRKGLFPRSKDGFERIPLYMSDDEDEDEIIDINKL